MTVYHSVKENVHLYLGRQFWDDDVWNYNLVELIFKKGSWISFFVTCKCDQSSAFGWLQIQMYKWENKHYKYKKMLQKPTYRKSKDIMFTICFWYMADGYISQLDHHKNNDPSFVFYFFPGWWSGQVRTLKWEHESHLNLSMIYVKLQQFKDGNIFG